MAAFLESIKTRESCRKFSTTPVEKEKLHTILEAARLAPSACNAQPWHFHVVTQPALLPQVAAALQEMKMNGFATQVPCFIVIQEGSSNTTAALGARLKKQDYGSYDIGLAVAHICYSAQELGLGSCIIGWFSQKELKKCLSLKEDSKPIRLIVALGYPENPALSPREKKRKGLEDIATFYE